MKKLLVIFLVIAVSFNLNMSTACASAMESKLTAADGAADDKFGTSVAVSGNTVVVGAPNDDDNGDNSGSAYVFVLNGESWSQQAKLTPDDGTEDAGFGCSVAIDGDTAIIGATSDLENNRGPGSAYVFIRIGETWSQQAKLIPDDSMPSDMFGWSVALDNNTAIIGAYGNSAYRGSVYVFMRVGESWTQQARIGADDTIPGDGFGYSVSLSGNSIVAGTPYDDDYGFHSGSAYVFVSDGNGWTQQAKLIPSEPADDDKFGYSISIGGDISAIGAYGNDGQKGSAYIFSRDGGIWTQQEKLIPADNTDNDYVGWSVAVSEDSTLVAAPFHNDLSGLAYLFVREEGIWVQQTSLSPSDSEPYILFGLSVAVSKELAVIGAPHDNENGLLSGSAYIFDLSVNLPPVADAGGPYAADEGYEIVLDASASYDLDDDIVLYEWDLDNDGEYDDASGVTVTTVFNDNGVYPIGLSVTDSYGAFSTDSTTVVVNDLGPACEFTWTPEPQSEGSLISFTDLSLSYPDLISSWVWDFAGVGSSTDQHPGFTFEDNGIYTVTLTVTDDDESIDTITHHVTVTNVLPVVDAGLDIEVDLGDMITIQAAFTDPGTADTHTATVYWGDNTSEPGALTEPGTDPGTVTGNHIYTWPGIYEVTVEVIDDDGGMGLDKLIVDVLPVAAEMIETLNDEINELQLPDGKGKSKEVSLDTAIKILNDSNPENDKAAVNTLEALINKLESQRGKQIPVDIADKLIAMAQEIIVALNRGA